MEDHTSDTDEVRTEATIEVKLELDEDVRESIEEFSDSDQDTYLEIQENTQSKPEYDSKFTHSFDTRRESLTEPLTSSTVTTPARKLSRKELSRMPINPVPTKSLDIFVFGRGFYGELGLASDQEPFTAADAATYVERPYLNENLGAKSVGIVDIAVGSKHCVALTRNNEILTWGCNDLGALGRDTNVKGVNEADPNRLASIPAAIPADNFEEGAVFVQVAATESATFALTTTGAVYGWGTFLALDGVIGFSKSIRYAFEPVLLPELKKIKRLEAGANHVLALDQRGKLFAWGCGQYNQLGRRVVERTREGTLVPREIGFPRTRIMSVACGADHSFALDGRGKAWAWGMNNYCEAGIVDKDENGEEKDAIAAPTIVDALKNYDIKELIAGFHHSFALLTNGKVLVWGRCDGCQSGLDLGSADVNSLAHDQRDKPRYITKPIEIPDFTATQIIASGDVTFALSDVNGGTLYSWGYSEDYRSGHGTEDDIPFPTQLADVGAVGAKNFFAGCGDTFGIIAVEAED